MARHGDERLVGAHVGRGLLAADVLLPGPQRGDVGRAGPRCRPSGRPAGRAAGGPAPAGRRTARGRGRRTTAACRTADPPPPPRRRRPRPARRSSPAATGSKPTSSRAPCCVGGGPGGADVLEGPEVVGRRRRAGRPAGRPAGAAAQSVTPSRSGTSTSWWPVPAAKVASTCRQCGWTPPLTHTVWRPVAADGQVDRLDRGGGAVVEGGVGDRQAGQPGDQGLVLEQRLQHALGHLGLVGRVGGHELGPERRGRGWPTGSRGRRRPPRRSRSGRVRCGCVTASRSISARTSGSDRPGRQVEAAGQPQRLRAPPRTARPARTGRCRPASTASSASVWGTK